MTAPGSSSEKDWSRLFDRGGWLTLIRLRLVELVEDPGGIARVRLTPAGAREIGETQLALFLERCQAGRHFKYPGMWVCACGDFTFQEGGPHEIRSSGPAAGRPDAPPVDPLVPRQGPGDGP